MRSEGKKSRIVSFILVLLVVFSVIIPVTVIADVNPLVVKPTNAKVLVNGMAVSFEAYSIAGNNYFKLRDIAKVVSGTQKQFAVSWDNGKKAINLISSSPYTPIGGELAVGDGTSKPAILNTSAIYKDGMIVQLTAYTIGGNNFFKLRDLAQTFDIGVTWDDATRTVGIDTSVSYLTEKLSESQKLYWALGADPKTIDPQLNSAFDGGYVINNLFEGLYRNSAKGVVPAIAESYTLSADKMVYTFTLKKAKWSDGSALTARDFEYAWKRALNPLQSSEYAFQLYYIQGARAYHEGKGTRDDVMVKALDDYILQVTLASPTPFFIDLLTFYTYFPTKQSAVESGSDGAWAVTPSTAISNGPFMLTQYKTGQLMKLNKNPNYWNAHNVKLDSIDVILSDDQRAMLSSYEQGVNHIVDDVLNSEIPRLIKDKKGFFVLPRLGNYYYIFNVEQVPVNDVRVRKALSLAIDRKAIVDDVVGIYQTPATGFVPPALYDANGEDFNAKAGDFDITTDSADIIAAKALLAEAGYPDGKGFPTIEVYYNNGSGHREITEAIISMWKTHLNIDATLRSDDWGKFQDERQKGAFTIARAGWIMDFADPYNMLEMWLSNSPNNAGNWNNAQYDALLAQSMLQTGQARFETLYKAQQLLMADSAVIPIYYYTDLALISNRVKGWEKFGLGFWYFGNARLIDLK